MNCHSETFYSSGQVRMPFHHVASQRSYTFRFINVKRRRIADCHQPAPVHSRCACHVILLILMRCGACWLMQVSCQLHLAKCSNFMRNVQTLLWPGQVVGLHCMCVPGRQMILLYSLEVDTAMKTWYKCKCSTNGDVWQETCSSSIWWVQEAVLKSVQSSADMFEHSSMRELQLAIKQYTSSTQLHKFAKILQLLLNFSLHYCLSRLTAHAYVTRDMCHDGC